MRVAVIPSMKGVRGPNLGIAYSPTDLRSAAVVGLKRLGIEYYFAAPTNVVNETAICWGWRFGKILRNNGCEVLLMERGYIGDRYIYTSLGWNGLNGYGTFPEYQDDGGERFRAHGGEIKPWKDGGKYILILGQVTGDQSLKGRDLVPWYQQIAERARSRWKVPVYFRPHPMGRQKGYSHVPGIENFPESSLDDALSGALFTIAFNSNSCLDSILAGVPCYAGDKGTMAWDLCMRDITNIVRPDREKVVHKIAWTQWSREEIEEGTPLKRLLNV